MGDTGSFSAAADLLDYTQPAVSKIVAGLEQQVGTTLVDRGLRPLRLTEAGSALARRAVAVFEQLAVAELELDAIANLSAGSLRVGTFSSAGAAMVVDALRALRASHPEITVSVAEIGMPSALVRKLRAGELDLGVSFDHPEVDASSPTVSTSYPSWTTRATWSCPAATDSSAASIRFGDLRDEDWLLPDFGADSPSFRMIDRRCREAGFEPSISYRINDCQMTQALVAAGEGIAILPRLMLQAHIRAWRSVRSPRIRRCAGCWRYGSRLAT